MGILGDCRRLPSPGRRGDFGMVYAGDVRNGKSRDCGVDEEEKPGVARGVLPRF